MDKARKLWVWLKKEEIHMTLFICASKPGKLIYGVQNQNSGCLWGYGLTENRYEGTFCGNGDV